MLIARSTAALRGGSKFGALVDQGYVAPSPTAAVERIERRFGAWPNRFGTNCPGLAHVRETIRKLASDNAECFTNALYLVAPHTHWKPAPVVHSLDKDGKRYWIGPQDGRAPYLAVSFVLHADGPLPYEWADASCGLEPDDLRTIWEFVEAVDCEAVSADWCTLPFPIGLSISHRFKRPFDPPAFSTVELPASDEHGLACVMPTEAGIRVEENVGGQVGWTSAIPPEFDDRELAALTVLEKQLLKLPYPEASQLLASIARQD